MACSEIDVTLLVFITGTDLFLGLYLLHSVSYLTVTKINGIKPVLAWFQGNMNVISGCISQLTPVAKITYKNFTATYEMSYNNLVLSFS